jgi:hypothetical protein
MTYRSASALGAGVSPFCANDGVLKLAFAISPRHMTSSNRLLDFIVPTYVG